MAFDLFCSSLRIWSPSVCSVLPPAIWSCWCTSCRFFSARSNRFSPAPPSRNCSFLASCASSLCASAARGSAGHSKLRMGGRACSFAYFFPSPSCFACPAPASPAAPSLFSSPLPPFPPLRMFFLFLYPPWALFAPLLPPRIEWELFQSAPFLPRASPMSLLPHFLRQPSFLRLHCPCRGS